MRIKSGITVRRASDGTFYVWVRTPQGLKQQQVFEFLRKADVASKVSSALEKAGWPSRGAKPAEVLKE